MIIPTRPIPFLWHYIKLFKFRFLCLFILVLAWSSNEALLPYFVKLLINNIENTQGSSISLWDTFKVPIISIGISWITMEIAMRLIGIIEIYLFPQVRAKMRQDVFDWVKYQSTDYFTSNLSGSLGTKIADIPKSSQYIFENILWQLIASSFALIFSLFIVAQASLIFTFLILAFCFLHIVITIYFLKEIEEKTTEHYKTLAWLNGETVDILTNAVSMKLFNRIKFETHRIKGFQNNEIEKSIAYGWVFQKINFLKGATGLAFIFITIYFLLKGWKEGWLSLGDIPLITMTSFNLIGLIWHLGIAIIGTFQDLGTLNGALSILRDEHKVKDSPNAPDLLVSNGTIEFRNVTFGYNKDNSILSGLTVTINPQEKIGLVGISGSGKTTFVNLILRTYDLLNGSIYIDNQNIAAVTQSSLRKQIAIITQDPSLFHRSIKENIAYGNPNATNKEIEDAAIKAHCIEFIQKLDKGYETIVGERGLKLSGGQRQRIAIARAFLKDAPIFILDEATSALDSETEKNIQDSLMVLMEEKTTIVIAHRLSTLKQMDRILVFDKGKIVEEGSQKQLLRKNGYFKRLWSLQQEGLLPDHI